MVKYAKNEAGDLVAEDGSILRRTDRLIIDLPLNEVVRTANVSIGDVSALAGAGRNINAYAELGNNTIQLLHQGELKPYEQSIRFHIGDGSEGRLFKDEVGIGWALTPNLDEGAGYHDRELTLSVRLPKAEFEWIWEEIRRFRQPALRVSLRLAAWQRDIDAHFGPDVGRSRFTLLATDSRSVWSNYSPIFGVNFHLDDKISFGSPANTADVDLEPSGSGPRAEGLSAPLSRAPQALALLRWITGLLILLILVTILR